MEYKEIKPGLENKEDLKKTKEKEKTDEMAAAKQYRKIRIQVTCRDPQFLKHSSTAINKL